MERVFGDAVGVAAGAAKSCPNGGVNAQAAPVTGDTCALGVAPVGRVAVARPAVGLLRIAVAARVGVVAVGADGVVLVAVAAWVVLAAAGVVAVAVAGGVGVGVGDVAPNWQALKVVVSNRSMIDVRHRCLWRGLSGILV